MTVLKVLCKFTKIVPILVNVTRYYPLVADFDIYNRRQKKNVFILFVTMSSLRLS